MFIGLAFHIDKINEPAEKPNGVSFDKVTNVKSSTISKQQARMDSPQSIPVKESIYHFSASQKTPSIHAFRKRSLL